MINRIIYTNFIFASVFFSISVAAQAQTAVKASIDRSKILIGEPIQLTLQADIPESQPIRFFQLDTIPHFEFLQKEKIDTTNTSEGTILTQVIHITSFDSGHWVIPSLVLQDKIATDSLPVDVGFSPFDPNQPYHDIKDIIEVTPQEKKDDKLWWYVISGILLLLLILLLVSRRKKKPVIKAVEPPPDPYKVAIDSLEKLGKSKKDAKQYYSVLTDIFRVYIADKKGIHSLQKTTGDLVMQLRDLNMHKELFGQLSDTLQLSDLVKFARYVPTADNDRTSFDIIHKSIDYIEQMQ